MSSNINIQSILTTTYDVGATAIWTFFSGVSLFLGIGLGLVRTGKDIFDGLTFLVSWIPGLDKFINAIKSFLDSIIDLYSKLVDACNTLCAKKGDGNPDLTYGRIFLYLILLGLAAFACGFEVAGMALQFPAIAISIVTIGLSPVFAGMYYSFYLKESLTDSVNDTMNLIFGFIQTVFDNLPTFVIAAAYAVALAVYFQILLYSLQSGILGQMGALFTVFIIAVSLIVIIPAAVLLYYLFVCQYDLVRALNSDVSFFTYTLGQLVNLFVLCWNTLTNLVQDLFKLNK